MEQAYDKTMRQLVKVYGGFARAESRFGSINALITAVMTGAIYIFVALKALAGLFGAGNLLKYVGAIQQVAHGVENLIAGVTGIAELHQTQYFFDLLDTPPVKYQGTLPVENATTTTIRSRFKTSAPLPRRGGLGAEGFFHPPARGRAPRRGGAQPAPARPRLSSSSAGSMTRRRE